MSSLRTATSVSRPKHDAGNGVKNNEAYVSCCDGINRTIHL